MDYPAFLRRGGPDWEAAERLLGRVKTGGLGRLDLAEVEQLAAAHRRVLSDFAWARTHFPGTEAERRLRALSFQGHRLFTGVEPPWGPRLLRFFRTGYPEVFRGSLPALRAALSLFVFGLLFGFVLTGAVPSVGDLFFGAEGVAGLRRGTIWTDELGEAMPASVLSSFISTNNMGVAMKAWALGGLFGVGTALLLLFNGAMVGSLLALCWRYELLDRVFAFISGHGPLELTLIIVAGAAGFELTRGLLGSGNRPRSLTAAEGGRRSFLLMAGTLPWFVLLGLLEGNLSPRMDIPTPFKAALGIGLLATFLLYTLRVGSPRARTP